MKRDTPPPPTLQALEIPQKTVTKTTALTASFVPVVVESENRNTVAVQTEEEALRSALISR